MFNIFFRLDSTKNIFDNDQEILLQEEDVDDPLNIGKNFECQTCGKAFGWKSHLKTHVKTVHEGIKDHKCHLCDSAFGQGMYVQCRSNNIVILLAK